MIGEITNTREWLALAPIAQVEDMIGKPKKKTQLYGA